MKTRVKSASVPVRFSLFVMAATLVCLSFGLAPDVSESAGINGPTDAEAPAARRDASAPDKSVSVRPAGTPTSTGILAFERQRGLDTEIFALSDPGGSNSSRFLAPRGTQPTFSPDGRSILFRSTRDGDSGNDGELYTMRPDGYGQTRLTNNNQREDAYSVSADGTKIAFSSDVELWIMNSDGSGALLLAGLADSVEQPTFAPDGASIVFSAGGQIWKVGTDGTGLQNVAVGDYPRFSPNGQRLIFSRGDDIFTSLPDGTGETLLIQGGPLGYSLFEPFYSSGGNRIAMSCISTSTSSEDVCVANADGSGFLSFGGATSAERFPVLSPDGSQIGYLGVGPSGTQEIFIASVQGGSPTVIYTETEGSDLGFLSWQYVCTNSAPIISDGLVSWWRGEAGAGDSFGTNNGAFSGANIYSLGQIGLAFHFDGSGNVVEIPDNPTLDVQTGNYTLAAWVRINSQGTHFVAGKGGCGPDSSPFILGVDDTNAAFLEIGDSIGGRTRVSSSTGNVGIGEWHHLVLHKEGMQFRVFKDANVVASWSSTGPFDTNDAPFTIGKGHTCNPPELTANATIDEVQLFNRSLGTSEVFALFSGNNPVCPVSAAPAISVKLSDATTVPVAGGRPTVAEVAIGSAAPAGGTSIDLASSDTGVVTVPSTVIVPEGQVQAQFPVTTTIGSTFRSADIIGSLGSDTARATVSVAPSAPDLAVSNIVAPAQVNVLENFTVSWTVSNVGEAATGPNRADLVYFSPDNVLGNGNDRVIATAFDDGVVSPGGSRNVSDGDANIPGNAAPVDGTYYLFVYVGNNVNERGGNFLNNFAFVPIQVNRNLPDIVVENLSSPSEVEPGSQFAISWDLRNAGSRTTATGFSHNVYLSFDQTVGNADDVPVTFRTSPALAPNDTGSYSQQFVIPTLPVRPSGDGLIYVRADEGNVVYEGDTGTLPETNNLVTRAVRFEYRVPDLQVQTVLAPASVESDSAFPIEWTTLNAGARAAGAMNERVYFSTDDQVNGNDVEIGSFPLAGGVGASQTVSRIQNVTIPTSSVPASGDFYVYVKSDADAQVDEGSNENNNVRFRPVSVRRTLRPDLRVTSVTAPPTAFFGQEIQVQFTVTNSGAGSTNAPQWTDKIYLSSTPSAAGATQLAAVTNVSSLNSGESYIASATVRVPRGFNGSYYVFVSTDTANTVNEEVENNNSASSPIAINIPLLPDLRVSNVQAPDEGFAGQPVSVNWTVTNNGDGATPVGETSWFDTVYLSRDAALDGGDQLVATRQHSGSLGAGAAYTAAGFTFNLPANAIGQYYVFVVTDAGNQVYEFTAENNNDDYDRIEPGSPLNIVGTPPDLTVAGNVTAPSSETAGRMIAVQFQVLNQGAFDATGIWREAVYLSADQAFDPGQDTLLGSVQRSGLAAGSQYGVGFDVRLPNCLQGTYYLFAVTDSTNAVFEYDPNLNAEANNVSPPKAISLQSVAPDLQITQMTVPPIVINGVMPVSWTVRNAGTGNAETGWTDRVFVLSNGQIITLGYFDRIGGLAANAEYTQNKVVNLPYYLAGDATVYIQADAYDIVPECSFESNNSASRPTLSQQDLPDLRINAVNSPPSAELGQTLTVSWTGGNHASPMQTATWADGVYLSSDTALGAGDTLLASAVSSAALGNGQSYNSQAQVRVPNLPVGNYFLIVAADDGNNVAEGVAEGNNASSAVPIQLTAPQVDLQATGVSANPVLYAGQFADISWTVTNLGASTTGASNWTDYVILSRDSILDPTDPVVAFEPRNGALGGGAGYTVTRQAQIPNGLTGDYKIFVITDRNNVVFESSEANNTSAALAVSLQLPPPAELNITNITPPATVTLGEPAEFVWTVQNSSSNAVNGTWIDSVYLSTDAVWDSSDALVAQKQRSGAVAPFATYTETVTTTVPPLDPGDYYVIVRTDARNAVRESDETNNIANSTGRSSVGVAVLLLGSPVSTTLVTGQERFYSIPNVPLGETLLVSLDGQSGSSNELYTRGGSMVSRANYEFQGLLQGGSDQENLVPDADRPTYYSMARGDYVPGTFAETLRSNDEKKAAAVADRTDRTGLAQSVTVKAELVPFSVRSVSPATAGNRGLASLQIDGAKFANGATVKLAGANNVEILPVQFAVAPTRVAALFDLKDKPAGTYDVIVTNPNNASATLAGGFEIVNGGGYYLRSGIVGQSATRGGIKTRVTFSASNDGLNDALNVPIFIQLPADYNFTLDRSNFLEFPTSELPADANPSQIPLFIDRDGVRTIMLYAPLVRSRSTIEIKIDIDVPLNFGSFPASIQLLPPLGEVAKGLGPGAAPAGGFVEGLSGLTAPNPSNQDCWKELFRQVFFAILNEVLPGDCLAAGWSLLAGSADVVTGLLLKGASASNWDVVSSLASKFVNTAGKLVECAGKQIPWLRAVSIVLTLVSMLSQLDDCLGGNYKSVVIFRQPLSIDPNEKIGPEGFGPERFIGIREPSVYRINFENLPTAQAPAQRIRIIDQLPPTLDPRTVRLLEIGFKQYRVQVPANRAFFQTRLQLGPDVNNLQAEISAGLNIADGTISWNLTAIDPATNERPINPYVGILPPNNAQRDGEGYVLFSVKPKSDRPTRTDIANFATIIFDENEPIVTNTTSNLLDSDVPSSSVSPLPATTADPVINVNWTGGDAPNGSGFRSFDVFVSENGGPFRSLVSDTTDTGIVLTGKFGRTYSFYSIARDNAGNVEDIPVQPDATVRVLGGRSESDIAPRPEGDNDGSVNDQDVTQVRRFAANLDTGFQYNEFARADSAPRVGGGNGVLSVADVVQARRFEQGLDPVTDSSGPNSSSVAGGLETIAGKRAGGANAFLPPRALRVVKVGRVANKITVAVELDAQGDETGAGFSLTYDSAVIANPSAITLGSGGAGASIAANTAQPGLVGIVMDKLPTQNFGVGSKQLVTLEFDVLTAAASTFIGFGNAPAVGEVVNGSALSLTTAFTGGTIDLLGPTSASVTVGGRILDADGNPLRMAEVRLVDATGSVRTTVSGSMGRFLFEDVEAGSTCIVSVRHKRHVFEPAEMIVTVNESIADLDFRARR